MSSRGPYFFEAHLTQGEWGNIPDDLATWYAHNYSHESRLQRQIIINEAIPIMNHILAKKLTPRQREVVLLYFGQQKTEVQIAARLGITQQTVGQHLTGKKRHGKKIGGAIKRIRKFLRKYAREKRQTGGLKLLLILDALLDRNTGRRRATELFKGLGDKG